MRTITKRTRAAQRKLQALLTGCFATLLALLAASSFASDNVLSFSAKTDYITTPARITTTDFTIEAWVRMTEETAENQILGQYIGRDPGRMIFALKDDRPSFFIAGWLYGTPVDLTNKWTHVAATRSDKTWTIYVNGLLNTTAVKNNEMLSATDLIIGNITTSSTGFRGQIADVRVWSVARSQADIQSTMNVRLAGNETDLSYYWPMNEGSGTTVFDSAAKVGGQADGTVNNCDWITSDLPITSDTTVGAWSAATGGKWSVPANWLDGTVASGTESTALFTNQPPNAVTITNDLATLRIGHLTVESASSHTFSGNTLTFSNNFARSILLFRNGAHTLDLPIAVTGNGLALDSYAPATLAVNGIISGAGAVAINSAASGGGIVTPSVAHTYTGATITGAGTYLVDTINNGGVTGAFGASTADPANLVLGPGTLHITDANVTTDRGYTLNAGASPVRAAIMRVDGDLTIAGQVLSTSGAFIKSGPGTLRYIYPGENTLSLHQGNYVGVQDPSASGDSPTVGFAGFNINDGTVIMGVPGQTNIVDGRILIGLCTTTNAGEETEGELIINDGTVICGNVGLSWNNGTEVTAGPEGTRSRLIMNGGLLDCNTFSVGMQNSGLVDYNARPAFYQYGGVIEAAASLYMAETEGAYATGLIAGGKFISTSNGSSVRLGGHGQAVLTVAGSGELEAKDDIVLAYQANGKGRLNLNGGIVRARNIVKYSGPESLLYFNGGTFQPHTEGQTLSGLTAAYVSTNGAVIDTSLADYTVAQSLLHDPELGATTDGGLIKTGSGTLIFNAASSTYNGDTVVSNGVLRLLVSLPAASALVVAPDGELQTDGNPSVGNLTLEAGGALGFGFTADGTLNDQLTITASPVFGSGVIALYLEDSDLPFTKNGTYTIMNYSGATPDVSALSCANPVFGKLYSFAASGGAITVTIATDSAGASVWNVNGSGNWATGSNWTLAQPGIAGSTARFDDAITAPVTVSASGESAGALYFNSPYAYTIGGSGLTLDNNGVDAHLTIESGEHAITAPVTLNDDTSVELSPGTTLTLGAVSGASATLKAQGAGTLTFDAAPTVNSLVMDGADLGFNTSMSVSTPITLASDTTLLPATDTAVTLSGSISGDSGLSQSGSAIVTLTGNNTYSGPTRINAGTLEVENINNGGDAGILGTSSAEPTNLLLGPGTLRVTGANVVTDRGYTVDPGESPIRAAILDVDGDLTIAGQVQAPSGCFIKSGPGTLRYTYTGANKLNNHNGPKYNVLMQIDANGDSPTEGYSGYNIINGTVIMGVPNQTNNVIGRLLIGMRTTAAADAETAGELILNDGYLHTSGSFGIGWNNGSTFTAGEEGLKSRFIMNGGHLNCPTLSMGLQNSGLSGYNARPEFYQYGGLIEARIRLYLAETAGSICSGTIAGGRFHAMGTGSVYIGGNGEGILTITGDGELEANDDVTLAYTTNGKGRLNLNGGTLIARNIIKRLGPQSVVYFNGGVFRPHTAGQTMQSLTAAYVSTNGVTLDNTMADYTIAQNLLTDPALNGAKDGGLLKTGSNPLTLSSTANTFNGPVRVTEGTLSALLGGVNDLAVAEGATFDALAANCAVGALSGEGELINGIITVNGALDCGDSGAEAGAVLEVANLTMAGGSSFVCDWSTNAVGAVTCDYVAVGGELNVTGPGLIDFNRELGNPIPMPFEVEIMSYSNFSGSFAGWKAIGTGLPENKAIATVVTAADGVVTVKVSYGGLLMIVR